MQRDTTGVGRARVVAETIGEVVNSFVEPISWKTLVSLVLFICSNASHPMINRRSV